MRNPSSKNADNLDCKLDKCELEIPVLQSGLSLSTQIGVDKLHYL